MAEPTASPADLARLRRMVAEPDDGGGWDDVKLDTILQENVSNGVYNFALAAASVWEAKLGEMVLLTDTTESSSSRRNSQAFDHALKMIGLYRGQDQETVLANLRPVSQRIVRPTNA